MLRKLKQPGKAFLISALTTFITVIAPSALAETKWEKHHPRRDQINDRLQKQNRRIHNEVKEGDMTKKHAHRLHKEDRQIRQEERNMASKNGGHITKQQQHTLNQQENGVSKQIGQ